MSGSGSDDTLEVVTSGLVDMQGLELKEARAIAREVASQPDIASAAEEWARTGGFPHHPLVNGWTPAGVAAQFPDAKPSWVFTMLCSLRSRPELTERFLKYDRRPPFPRKRE